MPANAVILVAVVAALVTLPALIEVNLGTAEEPLIIPVAFYAVTSIAVIGLYLSFAIPIYLRWRHGDKFEVGAWNNGSKYKWMNPIAVAEIVIVSLYLMMPFVPGAVPFSDDFAWKFVNYAPIVTIGVLLGITIWWQVSAKHWFKGPIRNIDPASRRCSTTTEPGSGCKRQGGGLVDACERCGHGEGPGPAASAGPPAHVQIEQWLMGLIDDGGRAARRQAAEGEGPRGALGVSRMTLRQSLGSLETRGVVERIPGRQGGTFIRQPRIECDITGLAGLHRAVAARSAPGERSRGQR